MKILFLSSEVVPFAKTGGLADVAGSLPIAIRKLGHDIRIFMPRYKFMEEVSETTLRDSDVKVYFFEDPHFANRDSLYVKDGKDYPDNAEAFRAYCEAVIPFLQKINWLPDIIHCNDWQSAPVTFYIRKAREEGIFQRTATVYSIHNMAYQGPKIEGEESFAKIGILNADVINSVSETYAKEIQTKEYAAGLEDVMQERKEDIFGILNGVDYNLWNPATDKALVKRYSRNTLSLRPPNKIALQEEMGLLQDEKIPLLGITTRLDVQKGIDILAEALPGILELGCQIIILGTGDPHYHKILQELKQKYPKQMGLKLGFDAPLAQRIYAGSDMFLMPSRYEPCGLGQLISFKYGTIPIARKTGGLADTVHDYDAKTGKGDGFVFKEYSSEALLYTVKRAIEIFKDQKIWKRMQERVMEYDYSWDASAKRYISLYMKALDKVI
jgi:starch synthase